MIGCAIILLQIPNLRYLYGALPLATLAVAWVATPAPRAAIAGLLALIGLNLWFLPSSGWYDNDFAYFRRSGTAAYIERKAPVRLLIDELNRMAPGEPVALFSTDATAGLQGLAYNDTWHSEQFWKRVRDAPDAAAIADYLGELNIRYVVAPASREADFEVVRTFLERWLDPGGRVAGPLAIYQLRSSPIPIPRDTRPFEPGRYDDTEPRIQYSGAWLHDPQFAETWNRSLTYSDTPGDTASFTFNGSSITYIYTRAANRGTAEVRIDGRPLRRINQKSETTEWQASSTFTDLGPGPHTFEVRAGADGFVDLDAFEVQ